MRLYLLLIAGIFYCTGLQAQLLDKSNILHFDFEQKSDSSFHFSNPLFLTDFNKNGYNNQPYFISDDELYITVQTTKDTTQTDIYALDLKDKKITQVTKTIESEYSPTFIPPLGRDNYEFSCVRVEMDSSQRVWRFPLNRSNRGTRVFENIKNIGYHFWIDYRDLVLFAVDTPPKMMVADSRDESARYITSNIGRCFQGMPDGSIAYVEKVSNTSWLIKKLDTRTSKTSLITESLQGSEDFVVLRDGTIIMARGYRLYKFNHRKDIAWLEIANLSYYRMNKISRIAVNAKEDRIVLVIE